jgi:uncharacterized protein YndB with AHSA1/START domain
MKKIVIAALICSAPVLMGQTSPVTVTRLAEPEKALKFEVMVPAKLAAVWEAFTTKEGLATWLWSDVSVDLRDGGDWKVNFPGGSTGGGTIVSFAPERRITMRALAPDRFPEVRRERTTAVFDFEAVAAGTRVTLTQSGWKQGKEWDEAYDYLANGNAQLMQQLRDRFVKGPVDWTAKK